jgi:hypothetical protein
LSKRVWAGPTLGAWHTPGWGNKDGVHNSN